MTPIYHLTTPDLWRRGAGGDYRAASLAVEGFIHCAFAHQVAWAANAFYASVPELLALEIDPARLTSPRKDEPGGPKAELFPHVYGPIDREAVIQLVELRRDDDANWVFGE